MSQSEDSCRTGEGVFRCLSILRNLKLRKIDNSVLILKFDQIIPKPEVRLTERRNFIESLHLYD